MNKLSIRLQQNHVKSRVVPYKWIRIPGSGKKFYVESGILGLGIRNEAVGIRNPANNWNPESGIQVPEVPMKEIWNPVIGTRNLRYAIQNPRLSWIPLYGATRGVESKILKCEFIIFIKLRAVKRTTARRLREFILFYFIFLRNYV